MGAGHAVGRRGQAARRRLEGEPGRPGSGRFEAAKWAHCKDQNCVDHAVVDDDDGVRYARAMCLLHKAMWGVFCNVDEKNNKVETTDLSLYDKTVTVTPQTCDRRQRIPGARLHAGGVDGFAGFERRHRRLQILTEVRVAQDGALFNRCGVLSVARFGALAMLAFVNPA